MVAVHQRNAVFKTKHYSFFIKLLSYWLYCFLKSYGKNLYHFFGISSFSLLFEETQKKEKKQKKQNCNP